jgi:hypothetical protein
MAGIGSTGRGKDIVMRANICVVLSALVAFSVPHVMAASGKQGGGAFGSSTRSAPATKKTRAKPKRQEASYSKPKIAGRYVDICLYSAPGKSWNGRCRDAVANAFCRRKGFRRAVSFRFARLGKTRYLQSGAVCRHPICQGLAQVRCGK